MSPAASSLTLVDPEERLALHVDGATLYYRRLSLGALASLEKAVAITLPGDHRREPKVILPPHALEAAIVAHVLQGWEGVEDPRTGREVTYSPERARRLPAGARALLVRRAHSLEPHHKEQK